LAAASLVWLTGCETVPIDTSGSSPSPASATALPPSSSGSLAAAADPNDDLALGKRHFVESNFGLAELHFRRAVEKGPGPKEHDAEGWLGLAASYDRLRRFDLADRAYDKALALLGPTAEILNNQGYSYLLRGDFRRARVALHAAQSKDRNNPRIQNNLDLLENSVLR
jgi:Flp pilus assembly protein TadD